MTIDAVGNVHDTTNGHFAGHVQVEGNPEDVLGNLEAARAADEAETERYREEHARITRVVKALDRQTGRTGADRALDLEDTIQEVHAQLLKAKSNGIVIEREEALINAIARGVMREVGPMHISAEDRTAIIKMGAWRAAFMNENDREPTTKEVASEANRLRNEWPDPRHRPTKDFHLWSHGAMSAPSSIYASEGDASSANGYVRAALINESMMIEDHPFSAPDINIRWAEVGASCASRGEFGEGNMRDARTFLYAGMAQHKGAQIPAPGSLSKASVQACRDAVKDAGGIDDVIADFKAGKATPAVEALFRPWSSSPTSHSDRSQIVEVLELLPGGADEMWKSALRFSSREQVSRINQIVALWLGEPGADQAA